MCDCTIEKLIEDYHAEVKHCKSIGATVCLNYIPWDRQKGTGHLFCERHRVYVCVEGVTY